MVLRKIISTLDEIRSEKIMAEIYGTILNKKLVIMISRIIENGTLKGLDRDDSSQACHVSTNSDENHSVFTEIAKE